MTSLPQEPHGPDLTELRKDIDALKAVPTEDLIDPEPASLVQDEPQPSPSDAPGSELDEPIEEENRGD